METDELESLFLDACGTWAVDPRADATRLKGAAWVRAFRYERAADLRTALERAERVHPARLPTVPQLREILHAVKAERQRAYDADSRRTDGDHPMTPRERAEIAEALATEAAARAARLGYCDHWCEYLERIAEVYASNASRSACGESPLPLPRLADLLGHVGIKSVLVPPSHTAQELREQVRDVPA